jgi:hypothetical protein
VLETFGLAEPRWRIECIPMLKPFEVAAKIDVAFVQFAERSSTIKCLRVA